MVFHSNTKKNIESFIIHNNSNRVQQHIFGKHSRDKKTPFIHLNSKAHFYPLYIEQ